MPERFQILTSVFLIPQRAAELGTRACSCHEPGSPRMLRRDLGCTDRSCSSLPKKYDRFVGRLVEATDLNGVKGTYTYNDPLDRPLTFVKSAEQITFSYPNFNTVSTS